MKGVVSVGKAYPGWDVWVQQILDLLIMNFKKHDAHSAACCALLSINAPEELPATNPKHTTVCLDALGAAALIQHQHSPMSAGFANPAYCANTRPFANIAADKPDAYGCHCETSKSARHIRVTGMSSA